MRLNALTWLICLILGLLIYGGDFRLIDDAENRVLDMQFRWRGAVTPDSRIVIAGIDQETLAWAGRPMFAWGPIYAELTRAVSQASASALLLDLVFSPGSESVIRDHVRETGERLGLDLPGRFFREIGFEKPFRTALLEFVASGASLIAGYAWEKNQPVFSDPTLLHIARKENTGYFNLATSHDGVIRNVQLSGTGPAGAVHAVAMVAAMRSGYYKQPLSANPIQQISYRGPRGTIKTVPVRRLLESARAGGSLNNDLAGKIVLLGFTDITDFKATPYDYMPGVEIHANILDNILNDRFLQPMSRQHEIMVIVALLIGLLLIARWQRNASLVCAALLFVGWPIMAVLWFDPLVIPVVRPLLLLAVFITAERFLAYRAIYLDRRRVRAIFSRYVSDSVVKEILASNDRDFLQGKRRRLCILIADIRGFTSFSEQRDAPEIVQFLNAYFARLTDIIMANRGVVDKFLGDGLLAFFNAPVEHADYADDAVKAAREIIAFTASPEFKATCYGVDLKVGLALHAGNVVFGNIGSERKAEFTVIGDTVNACSRMESLNKEYQTSLLVSGEVVKSTKAEIPWKFLAKTSLRGKANEVELYTISNLEA
ncbi:MAG TPA: adenylate/guanylate cyclase domain-containing protein [Candidatus Rifleibacterium sp.]|nr:adenylate/guanylate cyclase domain-containing protein [Candidatus Rifleibacterium sp.]HPT44322.1 adenylate/guanylate cyclase domain-containing protein [Candidatus Rifleibacterium sp.]